MSSNIATTAFTSSTTSRPKSTATQAVCTWEGHCLGDTCSSENDCDNDWVCANSTCRTCCNTDAEPTFVSTQSLPSTTADPTTTPTPSPNSSIGTSPTASATAQAASNGLSTGAAAGVGVGSAAAFVICLVGGVLFFKRRRKAKQNNTHELETVPAMYRDDDDRKELYRHQATQELPTRHPPAELSAVEFAELQGSDVGDARVK